MFESSLKLCVAYSSRAIVVCLYSLCLLLALPVPAVALDPEIKVSQYAHTAWLAQDGYFSGAPRVVAQTTDGYLWIGTQSGILRFDGTRFLPWVLPGGKHLPSNNVQSLLGARDGSLWIGTSMGIAQFVDNKLVEFPDFHDSTFSIIEDRAGKIFFGRDAAEPKTPACEVIDKAVHCLDKSDGDSVLGYSAALVEDSAGDLWGGSDRYLFRWRPGVFKTYLPSLEDVDGQDGISSLALNADGSLWVGMVWTGKGRGLQRFKDGVWKPLVQPGLDSTALSVISLLLDRDGGLWVGTANQGIYHIHGSHVDRFRAEEGLSGNHVHELFEDREGGIWAVTTGGIDSFHQMQAVTYSSREGLSEDNVVSVVVSRDDTVWLANGNSLDSITNDHISSIQSGKGLPGNEVTALFVDHASQLWVGVDSDLFLYKEDRFTRVVRSDGSSTRFIVGMTEDANHDIWAEVSGSNRELIRIRNLKVVEEYPAAVIPSARQLAADRHGGIWLGLRDGNLGLLQDGQAQVFRFAHLESDEVRQVLVNPDESVFGTTAYGLIAWGDGKTQTLTSRNGLPCDGTIGVVWDNDGALWLYTECGLVRIDSAEVQRWWANPDAVVALRVFDAFDGVRSGKADFNPVAKSSDGRLWFANKFSLQMIDPAHLLHNAIPPPVHIESVVANGTTFSPTKNLRLPSLLRDLEIDYTGLSFVNPRRVQFRYKLEGRDAEWQDAGTRRQVFYNDLRPGRYRFRVIACNNDQVWNETGATLVFDIPPAWYQTYWFKFACAICLACLLFMLYRARIRSYKRSMRLRFEERLSERTRLAQDLHDTLLQTIQGSKLVADSLQDYLDDLPRARQSLTKLSQWLLRAMDEGRAALESLRSSTSPEHLSETLLRAAKDCAPQSTQVSLTITGRVRFMHPVAQDEVYRIASEAIRNACVHSGCSTMQIAMDYGRDLRVQIRDDGRGFDPELIHTGKPGHFGIRGMKERASRIGARLLMKTSAQEGTQLSLVVPGHVMFRSPQRDWRWFRSKLTRRPPASE